MFIRLRVSVALWKSKVNHVDYWSFCVESYQEIIGFHVPMEEILSVHVLNSGDHLIGKHADSFKGEFSVAELEKIF